MTSQRPHSLRGFIAYNYAAVCVAVLAFGVVANAETLPRTDLVIRNVTDLPIMEVSDGHLFHADALWVARSRQVDGEAHKVEIYSADGKTKLSTVELTHSIAGIKPWRDQSVLVHGFSPSPSSSRYTKIQWINGTVKVTVAVLPLEYFSEEFIGDGNRMFLADRGTNSVYSLQNGRFTPVIENLSGPGVMALVGDNLFVVENRDLGHGDENLRSLDLATGRYTRTFNDKFRNGLVSILGLPNQGLVASAEINANQVLLIDAQKNTLAHVLPIPAGSPRALATYGQCLLVGSQESRVITVFDLAGKQPQAIDAWDLSVAGSKFKKIRSLSVNPATGVVFARSSYGCTNCSETMSSVVAVEDPTGKLKASCTSANSAAPSFVAESENDPATINAQLLLESSENQNDEEEHEHEH